jgi:hypothetical protein
MQAALVAAEKALLYKFKEPGFCGLKDLIDLKSL